MIACSGMGVPLSASPSAVRALRFKPRCVPEAAVALVPFTIVEAVLEGGREGGRKGARKAGLLAVALEDAVRVVPAVLELDGGAADDVVLVVARRTPVDGPARALLFIMA